MAKHNPENASSFLERLKGADKMEEAFNQCPSLRSKYADQVRLWRMGIAM